MWEQCFCQGRNPPEQTQGKEYDSSLYREGGHLHGYHREDRPEVRLLVGYIGV